MAIYTTNQPTTLYWAESSGFIKGRDPMGIQNSSVVVYDALLPGITNLTQRIRYYGFYCWLLRAFDALGEEYKTSYKRQYDFIRRAELTLAFLMHHRDPDYSAIPGKAFAEDFSQQLQETGVIDLTKGADKGAYLTDPKGIKRSYWKYSSGAMGQYYGGALLRLSLVRVKENYYFPAEKGLELAEAFADAIDQTGRSTLLSILEKGQLAYNDLSKLEAFDISRIQVGTSEWQRYIDLLFNQDEASKPTFQRKGTLLYYLKEAGNESIEDTPRLLGEYFFRNPSKVTRSPHDTSLGWYLYYTQELVHYAVEEIFSALLTEMKKGFYEVNSFIDNEVIRFSEALKEHNYASDIPLHTWWTLSPEQSRAPLELSWDLEEATDTQEVYFIAFLLITKTYAWVTNDISAFDTYLSANEIQGRRGNIIELHQYLNAHAEAPTLSFFRAFIKKILNDHQIVAYNKMGNGEEQVHKFLIEHNHLIHINDIGPRMTTPRLESVRYILQDLRLLDKESWQPTKEGETLLNKHHMHDEGA